MTVVSATSDCRNRPLTGAVTTTSSKRGRSIFLLKTNALELLAGEPLTGYLKLPGEPLAGAVVPHAAVVRAEGGGWVYVLNSGGASFTRLPVALDHPVEAGWFLTEGVTTNDYVVVTGAQVLLSEELKASIDQTRATLDAPSRWRAWPGPVR